MSSSTLPAPDLSSGVFTDTPPRDIAVSVRGLSKSYRIARNAAQHTSAGEAIMHKLRHPFEKVEHETFWALNDVSFDIQKGDVVGIIGRNGAGKSTLLKILSRITEPTAGRIDLYGRVGSLLEVGTGFHPELTGRENIFLNGAILGMKKSEIARQFDAIVDFSGTEQFLDTPVKRYSSGMYVRLAFAVAAHLNPEILIIDEVLAVGDAEFQKKCLGKMQDVAEKEGRTIVFVSHDMLAVNALCTTAILLHQGNVRTTGTTDNVVRHYLDVSNKMFSPIKTSFVHKENDEIRLVQVKTEQNNNQTNCIDCRRPFSLVIEYDIRQPVRNSRLFFLLRNERGEIVFGSSDYDEPTEEALIRRVGRVRNNIVIPAGLLKVGTLYGTIGADIQGERIIFAAEDAFRLDVIENGGNTLSERHKRPGTVAPLLNWLSDSLAKP